MYIGLRSRNHDSSIVSNHHDNRLIMFLTGTYFSLSSPPHVLSSLHVTWQHKSDPLNIISAQEKSGICEFPPANWVCYSPFPFCDDGNFRDRGGPHSFSAVSAATLGGTRRPSIGRRAEGRKEGGRYSSRRQGPFP